LGAICALAGACGSEQDPARSYQPLTDAVALASGDAHSCALRRGGQVVCWGDNHNAQLGTPSRHEQQAADWSQFDPYEFLGIAPEQLEIHEQAEPVAGARDAVAVFAGTYHSCSVALDERVQCWGDHLGAQLGTGDFSSHSCAGRPCNRRATDVPKLRDVTELALGAVHSCALHGAGLVSCWGTRAIGRAKAPTQCAFGECSTAPVTVDLPDAVAQLAVGSAHSCARLEDGRVACWGSNLLGQLGIADPPVNDDDVGRLAEVPEPELVELPAPASELFALSTRTCAQLEDGSLYCWGEDDGQLLGSERSCPVAERLSLPCAVTPVRMPLPQAVRRVWLSQYGGCADNALDELWCWGWGSSGQLGGDISKLGRCRGDRCARAPLRIDAPGRFESILYDGFAVCGLSEDGEVMCWGYALFDGAGVLQPRFTGIDCTNPAEPCRVEGEWRGRPVELIGAFGGTCLRTDRGEVWCFRLPNSAGPLMVQR